MTPYKKPMNPFIQRMVGDMQLRNLADATIDAYAYHVDEFCQGVGGRWGVGVRPCFLFYGGRWGQTLFFVLLWGRWGRGVGVRGVGVRPCFLFYCQGVTRCLPDLASSWSHAAVAAPCGG